MIGSCTASVKNNRRLSAKKSLFIQVDAKMAAVCYQLAIYRTKYAILLTMSDTNLPQIILASSSPYRRQILEKLGLPCEHQSPDIDESHQPEETPDALVTRLAFEKAAVLQTAYPRGLIIGSDQVAVLDGNIITKPHSHENAVQQLQQCSGRLVTFLTSLCLLNAHTQQKQLAICPYEVEFLDLTTAQIESYLKKEQPYNCAGSFKSEGLGITLVKQFQGKDPNSLIGLPLIELCKMLRHEGIEPLAF